LTLEQEIWKASKGLGLNASIETTEALRLVHKFKLGLAKRLEATNQVHADSYSTAYYEPDEIIKIIKELKE